MNGAICDLIYLRKPAIFVLCQFPRKTWNTNNRYGDKYKVGWYVTALNLCICFKETTNCLCTTAEVSVLKGAVHWYCLLFLSHLS